MHRLNVGESIVSLLNAARGGARCNIDAAVTKTEILPCPLLRLN